MKLRAVRREEERRPFFHNVEGRPRPSVVFFCRKVCSLAPELTSKAIRIRKANSVGGRGKKEGGRKADLR